MYWSPRQTIKNHTKQLILVLVTILAGCMHQSSVQAQHACSDQRYQQIDSLVTSGDGMGHGPDIGSDEWKSVIEFRLGVRDHPNTPPPSSNAWCTYIEHVIQQAEDTRLPASPSFDCSNAEPGSSEFLVCEDEQLSALDVELAGIYSTALELDQSQQSSFLAAEQRGWIKGRDECWKSPDQKSCIANEYQRRIAELQARYRLVESTGPINYVCGESLANEVIVTFFDTNPKTLIAERGDSVALMFIERSANGSRYEGRNESFWEFRQGVAQIIWGYEANELICDIRQ